MHGKGPRHLRASVAAVVAVVLASLSANAIAQPQLLPTPTPTPKTTPRPTPTPEPPPNETPVPSQDPGIIPTDPTPAPSEEPDPSTSPGATPAATPTPSPTEEADPEDFFGIPPGFELPSFSRTPARNTLQLVGILEEVTEVGIPLQDALIAGMGRFPVAGLAFYSDDWMFPRYTPRFHLHEGLDIFADEGTPIRAPDEGVVTRVVQGPIGGTALWMRGRDGVQYYFGHMQDYAPGIEVGRSVQVGTVLGYVGDTGNAEGGAPHLHFEIHKPEVTPPKPIVDAWLDDALERAPAWADSVMGDVLGTRRLLRNEQALAGVLSADRTPPSATPEYSILLTLLDPVGGSIGLVGTTPIVPPDGTGGSGRFRQVTQMRVAGDLIASLRAGTDDHEH